MIDRREWSRFHESEEKPCRCGKPAAWHLTTVCERESRFPTILPPHYVRRFSAHCDACRERIIAKDARENAR